MPSDAERPSTAGTATTRDDALQLLKSGSPHERLRGARFFAKNARGRDAAVLKRLRSQETDSYVNRTLDLAIGRSLPPAISDSDSTSEKVNEERSRRARIDAIEWIAGLLLHEIASPIGLIAEAASREVPEYETSQLRTRIENLQKIFEGIEQLKNASGTPNMQQFDISSWLEATIDAEGLGSKVPISFQGAKPFMVCADPKLLRFAVCNGIKNAVEAIQGYFTDEVHPLIVTWGASDSDYWMVVRDRGPGIVGQPQLAFEIGKTTKQGHSGFGLAIALQAMESMDGTVILQPGRDTGAVYEVRWPR
jgi:signal transduction histidine kinase